MRGAEGVVRRRRRRARRAGARRRGRSSPPRDGSAGSRAGGARAGRGCVSMLLDVGADAVGREQHLHVQLFRRARRRPAAGCSLGSGLPFGRPRCEATITRRAVRDGPLDRRQRRLDPGRVGDRAVLQRDVEVGANERALAGEIEAVDVAERHRGASAQRRPRPMRRATSRMRFEKPHSLSYQESTLHEVAVDHPRQRGVEDRRVRGAVEVAPRPAARRSTGGCPSADPRRRASWRR